MFTVILRVAIPWTLVIVFACFIPRAARAAPQDEQAALKKNLEEKLAKPFVKKVAWRRDYAEARKEAAEVKRPIFVYFTRSFAP